MLFSSASDSSVSLYLVTPSGVIISLRRDISRWCATCRRNTNPSYKQTAYLEKTLDNCSASTHSLPYTMPTSLTALDSSDVYFSAYSNVHRDPDFSNQMPLSHSHGSSDHKAKFPEYKYSRTPLIRINWNGEPSG